MNILTVTQLTHQMKGILEDSFPDIWVAGELSNLHIPKSGHTYFTLKDEQSQIRAVLFRSAQRFLKFTLQQGMQVICRGRVSVYEPRGEYQLILEYIEPKGKGALQQAFEELKAKLEQEGLFDRERKRPLPVLPRRVGIITSPTGAALRDMLRVIGRRHPNMDIVIYPVSVQGAAAPPEIVEAVQYFSKEKNVDVLILGRGGGSLEDLWAFNEEAVARTIAASSIPIITAVGHETDYTIADFTADLRAPTPSAAAEMVVESEQNIRETIVSLESRLVRGIRQQFELLRAGLREKVRALGDPRRMIELSGQRLDELLGRLATGLNHHLQRERTRLAALMTALDHLSPFGILSRGYSITKKLPEGSILKDAADVQAGDLLTTTLGKGEVRSRVER